MLRAFNIRWIWAAAAICAVAAAAPRGADLVIYNHSPSMPVGFYVRANAKVPDRLMKGSIVTIPANAAAPAMAARRHFDKPHNRFIKRVAAIAGDRVCANKDTMTINDGQPIRRMMVHSASVSDRASFKLWAGCRVLLKGEVLLLGETNDSFDGRYWGPVSIDQIEGVWRHI